MPGKTIRVLLVDDSKLALSLIKKGLSEAEDIQIVGTAGNGFEALSLLPKVKPDIVCTDYFMPQMDGLLLTQKIMATSPLPILVMSGRLDPKGSQEVFQILEAGALDCIKKPQLEGDKVAIGELIDKLRILSKVFLLRGMKKQGSTPKCVVDAIKTKCHNFVIIGASTGGPNVLIDILSSLPASFPAPIVCIQHISHGFLDPFVDWLRSRCKLKVELLRADTRLLPGVVYIPKEDMHFEMKSPTIGGVSSKVPFQNHRPSITIGMKSVAEHVRSGAVGILLTGMGADGAEGMVAMAQRGALTIAQNEESCAVFGMPKEAIALGGASLVLNPNEIKVLLLRLFSLQAVEK
jgi:two-component system chemotaxis response regulator CheB